MTKNLMAAALVVVTAVLTTTSANAGLPVNNNVATVSAADVISPPAVGPIGAIRDRWLPL